MIYKKGSYRKYITTRIEHLYKIETFQAAAVDRSLDPQSKECKPDELLIPYLARMIGAKQQVHYHEANKGPAARL